MAELEVALTAGSLCAERAGIARAATEFFHAKAIKAHTGRFPESIFDRFRYNSYEL